QKDREFFSCSLCQHQSGRFLMETADLTGTASGSFRLFQCRRCGLISLWPLPGTGETSSFYPPSYYEDTPARRSKLLRRASRLSRGLRRYILQKKHGYPHRFYPWWLSTAVCGWFLPSPDATIVPWINGGRILDVGCGQGDFLLVMKSLGWETYGVEPNPAAVATATRLGISVHCGELNETMFPTRFFHVVRLHHVLEHIPNPVAVMLIIRRLLRDDGYLMITVPNINSPGFKIFRRYWWNLDVPRHVYFYSPETLTRLAASTGYRICQVMHHQDRSGLVRSVGLVVARRNTKLQKIVRRLPPVQIFGSFLAWTGQALHHGECFTCLLKPSFPPEDRGPSDRNG
ncbi:MAG TPA: class I SAM-dependent methyltransferase, partial [bacterium]|nr:class I SAM-dependent methyltransferase [bacterium]